MSQYIIIFTNNDGLSEFYKQIGSGETDWVDQDQMCFLPGDGTHIKFRTAKDIPAAGPGGVYLFYDGNNHGASYNKKEILSALRQLHKLKDELYLCYHDRHLEKIVKEIDKLKIVWVKPPLKRHHYELPYVLLADFFSGACSAGQLVSVWEKEEELQTYTNRKNLEKALRAAMTDKGLIDSDKFRDVVTASNLGPAQKDLLKKFETQIRSEGKKKEINSIREELCHLLDPSKGS